MNDFGFDLAVIGNGRTAALLVPSSRPIWWCFPRFDDDLIFCRLPAGDDEKGFSDVVMDGMVDCSSEYVRNVVSIILIDSKCAAVEITNFVPRFRAYDRTFRPSQLVRIIEPVSGIPRILVDRRVVETRPSREGDRNV
jgi:hypothetical protein